ncbi:MAG: HAD-IIIC family phosphatase, partial [Christensenellaceae bacterium]
DNLIKKKIALLSGTTIGEIKNILELFLLNYGIEPIFYEGDYGLFYEDAVFQNDILEKFQPDIIYIHTSNKNINEYPSFSDSQEDNEKLTEDTFSKFKMIWDTAKRKYGAVIIQNNFEMLPYRIMGNADCYRQNGGHTFLNELNCRMYAYANSVSGFYVNDINYLSACYGLDRWMDSVQWYLYKYSQSIEAIPTLCYNIANIIKAIYGKNKKALALDLDNTLWGGVIGDDGVDNIALGKEDGQGLAYFDFQQYLKRLQGAGIMLNVCSKNTREIAQTGFEHPASKLKTEDFICFEANWEPKHINIKRIAEKLNILPESIVFADDNPAEREIVEGFIPSVAIPELSKPEEYIREIDAHSFFEVTDISADDLKRNEYYAQNVQRQEVEQSFEDYEDYLKSLEMKCFIDCFNEQNYKRVTQLINKTNQFNFTTDRYTEDEVLKVTEQDNSICICGRLTDKFGDNGIVTAMIGNIEDAVATIDLWVMSCRTFKRDLEFVMFRQFVKICKQKNVKSIRGIYRPTKKNVILRDFYCELNFDILSVNDKECLYSMDVDKYVEKPYPMEVIGQ